MAFYSHVALRVISSRLHGCYVIRTHLYGGLLSNIVAVNIQNHEGFQWHDAAR